MVETYQFLQHFHWLRLLTNPDGMFSGCIAYVDWLENLKVGPPVLPKNLLFSRLICKTVRLQPKIKTNKITTL